MEYKIKEGNSEATIFMDRNLIDLETIKQIRKMIQHPSMENAHVRVMPDCSRAYGCCIGLTSELTNKIVPRFVGGDIGCGISCHPIEKLLNGRTIEQIEKIIKDSVPMGSGRECIFDIPIVSEEELTKCLNSSYDEAVLFCQEYLRKFKIDLFEKLPSYNKEWLKNLCKKIHSDYDYDLRCLGTLGAGNHYVEVNKGQNDMFYLTVHCGSRNLGSHVCAYHQAKIEDNNRIDYDEYEDKLKQFNRKIKDSKMRKSFIDKTKEDMKSKLHTEYLENDEAHEYYFDMIFSQKYAQLNRMLIIKKIFKELDVEFKEEKIIESIHNYIDFEKLILRKGAIVANKDQMCIVSLNMRDGILLCKGKGNQEWNYSSAHGSGRLASREATRQKYSMQQYKKSMEDVYSTTVCEETLEECPMAYKDTDIIKKALEPTVEIIEHLKPIINVKGFD